MLFFFKRERSFCCFLSQRLRDIYWLGLVIWTFCLLPLYCFSPRRDFPQAASPGAGSFRSPSRGPDQPSRCHGGPCSPLKWERLPALATAARWPARLRLCCPPPPWPSAQAVRGAPPAGAVGHGEASHLTRGSAVWLSSSCPGALFSLRNLGRSADCTATSLCVSQGFSCVSSLTDPRKAL